MTQTYTTMIRDLPVDERPRERLVSYGPRGLSAAELIAILLRIGSHEVSAIRLAERLLSQLGSLKAVANASVEELASVKGIGTAKAAQIQAAVELGKRLAVLGEDSKPAIRSSQDVHSLLAPELRHETREHFKVMLLDTKNQVSRIETVSVGGLNASLIHPRELYRRAITSAAASVIVAHNHPSGDPTPHRGDQKALRGRKDRRDRASGPCDRRRREVREPEGAGVDVVGDEKMGRWGDGS